MQNNWFTLLASDESPEAWASKIKITPPPPWVETLRMLARDSKTILSLGSGIGDVEARLALEGKNITGLELSDQNVEFSKKLFQCLGAEADLRRGDIQKPLPFDDKVFDLVYCCTVVQFFTDAQIRGLLSETIRVARKKVVLIVPNARCVVYRLGKWHMEKTGRWHWGKERPLSTLKPLFPEQVRSSVREYTVGAKHALDFLNMRGSGPLRHALTRLLSLKDHPRPARWRQGYMLVSIAELG